MVDVCHHTPGGNKVNARALTACLCLVLMVVTPACLRLWGEDNMLQWPDPGERERERERERENQPLTWHSAVSFHRHYEPCRS